MSDVTVTVKQLAQVLAMPVDKLVEQMQEAGIGEKAPDQVVTSTEKFKLLGFLRRTHGKQEAAPGGDDGPQLLLGVCARPLVRGWHPRLDDGDRAGLSPRTQTRPHLDDSGAPHDEDQRERAEDHRECAKLVPRPYLERRRREREVPHDQEEGDAVDASDRRDLNQAGMTVL